MKLAALFFIAFVCVGTFFLMNYQLAVVYSSSAEEKALRAEALRRRELEAAFERLDWGTQGRAVARRSSSTNCRARRPSARPASRRAPRRRARRWRRRSPCCARSLRDDGRRDNEKRRSLARSPPPLRARRPPLARRCDRTGERYEDGARDLAAVLSSPSLRVDALIVASVAAFALERFDKRTCARAAQAGAGGAHGRLRARGAPCCRGASSRRRRRRRGGDAGRWSRSSCCAGAIALSSLGRLLRLLAHVRAFARTFATLLKARPPLSSCSATVEDPRSSSSPPWVEKRRSPRPIGCGYAQAPDVDGLRRSRALDANSFNARSPRRRLQRRPRPQQQLRQRRAAESAGPRAHSRSRTAPPPPSRSAALPATRAGCARTPTRRSPRANRVGARARRARAARGPPRACTSSVLGCSRDARHGSGSTARGRSDARA